MFFNRPTPATGKTEIVLVSADAAFEQAVRNAFGTGSKIELRVVAEGIERAEARIDAEKSAVVIVDLDAGRREDLLALQRLMARLNGRPPVIVVTEAFDEAVARWLLQIRVTDLLRKPVAPAELLRTCVRAIQGEAGGEAHQAQICAFLPAAGGVGVTTIAIQTAFLLLRGGKREQSTTCLVDLDFQNGACADYLDLEPRLNFDEIGPHPERLDRQLLQVMLSYHASGLAVLAAPNRPAEMRAFDPALVTRMLDLVSAQFDNVVIDLPRAWFPWTDDVLVGSDKLYVVTEMTVPGLRLARRLSGAIGERLGEDVKPQVIVNRFEQRLFGAGLRRADVEQALDGTLAGLVSNNYSLVREAIDRGVPLEEVKPSNNVLTDLRKVLFPQQADK